ncbi:IS110 family transposase [bacterium]|nr:IS110 family transposase [bacterium]
MNFYTKQHRYYCGIDLHSKKMYVCILNQQGTVVIHKNIKAMPDQFKELIDPYLEDIVVTAECMFTWYWLADFCEDHNIPFVLGHALYMRAIHGGKAKNDKIDSLKIATLLRGGMLPQAYVYPKKMRSTRDLLRRRTHLNRKKSELMAHVSNTISQYNLPRLNANLKNKYVRDQTKEMFADKSVQRAIDMDIGLIDYYGKELESVEKYVERTAKHHDYHSVMILQSIPGVGRILSMVILYEIHDINRFESVQKFASYARLVKCKKESAGKIYGTSGSKIGNAHLRWAFAEAVVLMMREIPEVKQRIEVLSKKHGKAKAMTIMSHKIGRTVYFMLKRRKFFNLGKFINWT